MKHVAGNLKSRWTEFLTTDGEKPWRNRDDEFVDTFSSRQELLDFWEQGWGCLFQSLESLRPEDLAKVVTIRGEPHTVPLAIHRSLAHCGYHIGQIVLIARILAEDKWETLTIPRGESASFNQRVWGRGRSDRSRRVFRHAGAVMTGNRALSELTVRVVATLARAWAGRKKGTPFLPRSGDRGYPYLALTKH